MPTSTLTTNFPLFRLDLSMPTLSFLRRPLTRHSNSRALWLTLYFFFNLSLTLYNKSVLIHFPFPYTLTAIHAFCGSIGSWLLLTYQNRARWSPFLRLPPPKKRKRSFSQLHKWRPGPGLPRLSTRESIVLFFFSILYTINIVVSNASLRLVTVPFHQVVRAATPFFTLLFSVIILPNSFKCSRRKALSLVPVVAGVAFATYGDYYFTTLGFLLTLLGTVLAALKSITTHLILIKPSHSSSSHSPEPTLPLHSPVGYSTVSLPVSEKENVFYRHRMPLITTPEGTGQQQQGQVQGYADQLEGQLDPLLPPSPYAHHQPSSHSPEPTTTTKGRFQIPKLKLSPLHLLYLLSPLAFVQTTLLAHFTGELERVGVYLATLNSAAAAAAADVPSAVAGAGAGAGAVTDAAIAVAGAGGVLTRLGEWSHLSGLGGFQFLTELGLRGVHAHGHISSNVLGWSAGGGVDPRVWLVLNGVMAFWLNVVSFNANRRVGALGMNVAANVKQVLTILLAVVIFDLTITPANGVGVLLTILGGAGYAFVEFGEKRDAEERARRG